MLRLALLSVLAFLISALVPVSAAAQSAGACSTTPNTCDQGQAYSECVAFTTAKAALSGKYGRFANCEVKQSSGVYKGYRGTYQIDTYRDGRWSNVLTNELWWYAQDKSCSSRSSELGWEGPGTAAIVTVCDRGCMYSSSLDPAAVSGVGYDPTGAICTTNDAPAPTPATPGGDDDGGGTGGETGGGGDSGSGGDGGGDNGSGGDGGSGGGDGGGGDGDGGGNSDGGGDSDGDGDGDGENPSLPENPTYPGDVPMPYADPPIPASYTGQWSSGLGNGSCPAPKSIAVGLAGISTTLEFSFKPLCDFASLIRGLVIACAAIAAAYIILGLRN